MQYLIGFAAAAATIWPLTAADELVPVPPRLLLEESLLGSTFDNPGTTPKIVGGEQVPRTGQYPWYSAFYARTNGSFYCGGQLISPNYILTAAHCEPSIGDTVIIGEFCPSRNDNCGEPFEARTVSSTTADERYTTSITFVTGWDYLLVRLSSSVTTIEPVMLDSGSFSPFYPAGKRLWAIGLGVIDVETGDLASQLRHVELEYVPQDSCRERMKLRLLGEATICAEDSEKKSDVCNGDSGGPLYDSVNKVLVGLTSYGDPSCVSTIPGVYARISDNFAWIQFHVCVVGDEDFSALCNQAANSAAPTSKWCRDAEVEVTLNVDEHPEETQYFLTELLQNEIILSGSLPGFEKNEDHKGNFCLPVDAGQCYRFEIQDTMGNGIDLEGTDNDYCLKVDGKTVKCNANFVGSSESIIFPVENCGAKTCSITTYELEIETSSTFTTMIAIQADDDDGTFVFPYYFSRSINFVTGIHSFPIDLCSGAYKIVVANLGLTKMVLYNEEGDEVLTQDDLKAVGFLSSTLSALFENSSSSSSTSPPLRVISSSPSMTSSNIHSSSSIRSVLKATTTILSMISLVVNLVS